MNRLLQKLLSPRNIEYLTVDRDLIVREKSFGVQQFADSPSELMVDNDVRIAFPELIGLEDTLYEVLEGQTTKFELKGIARYSEQHSPLYIDLYVTKYTLEDDQNEPMSQDGLLLCFEEVTERMVLEQKLAQVSNEDSLVMRELSASRDYLDKILNSMVDALIVTTTSGEIKLVNQKTERLFEYSESELLGESIGLIIPEINISKTKDFEDYQGELFRNQEVVGCTKVGEKIVIALSCSVIANEKEYSQDFVYTCRHLH